MLINVSILFLTMKQENKSYEISENKKKSVSSKKNKKRKIVEKLNYEVENSLKKIKKVISMAFYNRIKFISFIY